MKVTDQAKLRVYLYWAQIQAHLGYIQNDSEVLFGTISLNQGYFWLSFLIF